MEHVSAVHERLIKLKHYDDAAHLFSSLLNYDYSSQKLSTKRFPSSLDGSVKQLNILATHNDFKVIHCEVDKLLLGIERPIINNLLRDHPYSLFLFSDSSKDQWHFINVKYDEEETRRKLFRRIVVGPDERLHTAAQRILMLEVPEAGTISPLALQQKHDEAFDVEKVTKEFFSSFVGMFHLLRSEIEDLNPRHAEKSREYSQILLNRLMFLYFVQKKGWLSNNKNFLFENFKKSFNMQPDKHNYYSDIVLRVFQRLATSEKIYSDLGAIPFLNGGLFEMNDWEPSLKIRNTTFAKMFKELFEHYNFTVREDTAMDMEVAIDPEMLGKVFENLILTLEKDPKTDLRKATGSFYTPRVIVHYMCQQSLKEYLIENTTDEEKDQREKIEKLFTLNPAEQLTDEERAWLKQSFTNKEADQIKQLILACRVCDPAVGSGAFVVGMLHEMIAIIKLCDFVQGGNEEIRHINYDYELKRKIIENCLYGVDIQEQAVRICELRLWLSLVVDYNGSDIPPLPNLSYRIRQGNSLIDQLFGYNVNLNVKQRTERGEKIKQLIDGIQNDKHAYFYESDAAKKRKADLKIMAKQCDLATLFLMMRQNYLTEIYEAKYGKSLFGEQKLKKADEEEREGLRNETKEIERLLVLAKNTKEKLLAIEKGKLRDTDHLKHLPETFIWKMDFAEVFREKDGFDITIANPPYGADIDKILSLLNYLYPNSLKNYGEIYKAFFELGLSKLTRLNGNLVYISPNTFMGQPRYKDLRGYLLNYQVISLINLGEKVFDAIVPVCIIQMKKIENKSGTKFFFADLCIKGNFSGKLKDLLGSMIDIDAINNRSDRSFLANLFLDVKTKLTMNDVFVIKDAGIQYHRSGIGLKNKGGNDLYERIFSDSKKTFKNSIPTLYGKNIDRWIVNPTPDEYFNLEYKLVLKKNETVSFSKDAFEKPIKFLWRQTSDRLSVSIDKEKKWFRNTVQCCWIKDEYQKELNIYYVVGVLNSTYMAWAYDKLVRESGRVFPQVKIGNVKQLPFIVASENKQIEIAGIVKQILDITKWPPSQHELINKLQYQLDEFIFNLFGIDNELKKEINLYRN